MLRLYIIGFVVYEGLANGSDHRPMLTRLYVDNYKCFSNFEIAFEEISLLVGANGTGKSTCLEVLHKLRLLLEGGHTVEDLFPGSSLTRWQDRRVQRFEVALDTEAGRYDYEIRIEHTERKDKCRVLYERLTLDSATLFSFDRGTAQLYKDSGEPGPQVPMNWIRSGVAEINEGPANKYLIAFRTRFIRTLVFSPAPALMDAFSPSEVGSPKRDLSDFTSWYRFLSGNDQVVVGRLFEGLQEVLPGFHALRISGAAGDIKLTEALFHGATDSEADKPNSSLVAYRFNELSDGQRMLIALYAIRYFLGGTSATLCFDEPDNFLALREIQPWLHEMSDLAEGGGAQCILVSHHPELIDQLARDHGILLSGPAGGPIRTKRIDELETTSLPVSEIIARGWES